jgi:hypothetical protein
MDRFHGHDMGMSDLRPLPLAPTNAKKIRRQGKSVATEAIRRRMQQIERSSSPDTESRAADKNLLEEENRLLKKQLAYQEEQLAYQNKLDRTTRTFLEEVRSASERLQTALLQFRHDQKAIDHEFIQAGQF